MANCENSTVGGDAVLRCGRHFVRCMEGFGQTVEGCSSRSVGLLARNAWLKKRSPALSFLQVPRAA